MVAIIFSPTVYAHLGPPPPLRSPSAGERGSGLTGGGSTTYARQPTIVPNDDKRRLLSLYTLFLAQNFLYESKMA